MGAYYNEIDPYAAQWLRNLIAAGHIATGDVDERSIVDVRPDDLRPYRQCHFFAGIGGWSYALRLAGWPDDRPIWTGSCPCQPFSAAGKRTGGQDERHLWPHWFNLIRERRPPILFGENVEATIGWGWLDAVLSDLEAESYATGAAVLPACSIGAPHIRQRVWFVADANRGNPRTDGCGKGGMANADASRRGAWRPSQAGNGRNAPRLEPAGLRADGVADAESARLQEQRGFGDVPSSEGGTDARKIAERAGASIDGMGNTTPFGQRPKGRNNGLRVEEPSASFWSGAVWLLCTDGKARPAQPGIFPLVTRLPTAVDGPGPISRVGTLRGAGNAIVPSLAAEFIKAVMQC